MFRCGRQQKNIQGLFLLVALVFGGGERKGQSSDISNKRHHDNSRRTGKRAAGKQRPPNNLSYEGIVYFRLRGSIRHQSTTLAAPRQPWFCSVTQPRITIQALECVLQGLPVACIRSELRPSNDLSCTAEDPEVFLRLRGWDNLPAWSSTIISRVPSRGTPPLAARFTFEPRDSLPSCGGQVA